MPVGTYTLINQFNISSVAYSPNDFRYDSLLTHIVSIKRVYDNDESVKKVNAYGEVVMTYPTAQVVASNIKVRIEPIRQRGELGFSIKKQGGDVYATYKMFMHSSINVEENDIINCGTREYQVLLVDEFYGAEKLHHKELLTRRIDNL